MPAAASYIFRPIDRFFSKLIFKLIGKDATPIANFFWDGPKLTVWSKACIHSFNNNGFIVNVYTYSDTLRDEFSGTGITVVNAEEICEKSFRDRLFNAAKPNSYGKTYACFTDFFRLRLLSDHPRTWWFDTDVFCLKNAKKFKELELSTTERTICGHEDSPNANVKNACNAILWFGDKSFAKETFDNLVTSYQPFNEHEWSWAQTAIPYLNNVILHHPEKFNIQNRNVFYPLSWRLNDISMFMLPENANKARAYCDNSLTLHFWNEIFTQRGISRNQLPPDGSFLHELIVDNIPATSSIDLLDTGELRQKLSE